MASFPSIINGIYINITPTKYCIYNFTGLKDPWRQLCLLFLFNSWLYPAIFLPLLNAILGRPLLQFSLLHNVCFAHLLTCIPNIRKLVNPMVFRIDVQFSISSPSPYPLLYFYSNRYFPRYSPSPDIHFFFLFFVRTED